MVAVLGAPLLFPCHPHRALPALPPRGTGPASRVSASAAPALQRVGGLIKLPAVVAQGSMKSSEPSIRRIRVRVVSCRLWVQLVSVLGQPGRGPLSLFSVVFNSPSFINHPCAYLYRWQV